MKIDLKIKNFSSLLRIIIINILVIYSILYFSEIYFQIINKNLFKQTSYYKFKEISANQELISMVRPTHLKDIHSNKILPVSGVSNVKTLLCYDDEKPIIYKSDSIGFDNESNEKNVDAILIGDSYAAGYCANKENRFNYLFKKRNIDIINFGMSGNGPLLEFASLVEYQELFNYNTIIWFFTPDNDYQNFEREMQNPILKKYLDINFKQDLIKLKKEKDDLYYEYFKKKERPIREFLRKYHLDLKFLRKKIQNIDLKKDHIEKAEINRSNTNKLFYKVFKNLKTYAEKNEKKLLIVINLLTPNVLYDEIDNDFKKSLKQYKLFLKKTGINYYDFNEYIYDNYNESNIEKICKKRFTNEQNYYWDHYTEEGYRLLTDKISIIIKKM